MDQNGMGNAMISRTSSPPLIERHVLPSSPSSLTTGTTASSNNTLPSTPDHAVSRPDDFSLQRLDDALKRKIKSSAENKVVVPDEKSVNPYADWQCAFGFDGHLDEPRSIPTRAVEFVTVVKVELQSIRNIQNGLKSYLRAITSGEHHTFDEEFLKSQRTATAITTSQLEKIACDLREIVHAVEMIIDHAGQHHEVQMRYKDSLGYAQPWVIRTRAILISAHVFYKVNYVLGSSKQKIQV